MASSEETGAKPQSTPSATTLRRKAERVRWNAGQMKGEARRKLLEFAQELEERAAQEKLRERQAAMPPGDARSAPVRSPEVSDPMFSELSEGGRRTRIPLSGLAEDSLTKVMVGEVPVVVVRSGGVVRAFGAACPHAGGPLEQGALCEGRLVCPWHKGTFSIEDGALLEPPALDGLKRYPVRMDAEYVTVSSDPLPTPLPSHRQHAHIAAIVGSGAAGAAAACTLRQGGFDGRVLLIGEEARQPYDRTVLSKFVVAGEMDVADVPPLQNGNNWQSLDVEQLDITVTSVDAAARRIKLADGSAIDYDCALLAIGSVPRRPHIRGISLEGVHTLRSRLDAAAILQATARGGCTVIMGSSFIGLEVACGLRHRGIDVVVVAPEKIPFARQFGDEVGASLRRLHEANGVTFRLGTEVAELEGAEYVEGVTLKDGERLRADCVVVGVGVTSATDFVAGVEKGDDGSVVVDDAMQAADGLFAAGDCARFPWRGEYVRIEHWRVAQQHGRVAAQGMMGREARYEGVPFFWTYHYGKRFEYLGHARQWDETQIDGDLDAQNFIVFQITSGEVAGVIACGRETQTARLIEHMRRRISLPEARAIVECG